VRSGPRSMSSCGRAQLPHAPAENDHALRLAPLRSSQIPLTSSTNVHSITPQLPANLKPMCQVTLMNHAGAIWTTWKDSLGSHLMAGAVALKLPAFRRFF